MYIRLQANVCKTDFSPFLAFGKRTKSNAIKLRDYKKGTLLFFLA